MKKKDGNKNEMRRKRKQIAGLMSEWIWKKETQRDREGANGKSKWNLLKILKFSFLSCRAYREACKRKPSPATAAAK